jgi:S1-C subfamily serine protease
MGQRQIRRPQSLLTLGIVVLIPGLAVGFQPDSTNQPGRPGKTISQPVDEGPAPGCNGNLEGFAPTVKKVTPAVVRIVTALRPGSLADVAGGIEDPFWRHFLGQMPRGHSRCPLECGLGSGVIVTEDGFILTNSHLVNGPRDVEVTLQDGREFNARVIGLDAETDIAVVKIDAGHLPTVPLAESRNVKVGDLVLAIDNPFGVGQTVTHGIVSATDRGGIGIEDYESFIQTDAPLTPATRAGRWWISPGTSSALTPPSSVALGETWASALPFLQTLPTGL